MRVSGQKGMATEQNSISKFATGMDGLDALFYGDILYGFRFCYSETLYAPQAVSVDGKMVC